MTVLDDLLQAIRDYPNQYVKISIPKVYKKGEKINPGEPCVFQVRLENMGKLRMTNVQIHIQPIYQYVTVMSVIPFLPNVIQYGNGLIYMFPAPLDPNEVAYSATMFKMVGLLATPDDKPEDLFKVYLSDWDTTLVALVAAGAGIEPGVKAVYRDAIVST